MDGRGWWWRARGGWRGLRRAVRMGVVGVVLLGALLGLAQIHACACTGGQPVWKSIYPPGRE